MNGFINKARYIKIIIVLALVWSAISTSPAHALEGCYVNVNATGNNTGGNWANAYTSLQSAIADIVCTEIWVAAGTYKPHTSDRTISFNLENDLRIYGGFVGTETLLSQRNPAANPTILSGDIDNNDTNTDGNNIAETTADIQGSNSYHVVIGSGTNSSAILDGFTITAGQANGSSPNSNGGGMYNDSGSPTVSNTAFSGNSATHGGGMYNTSTSNPTVSNTTFSGNSASSNGGGMYNSISFPTISNSTFSNNSASIGGGMFNVTAGNPTINNSTFSNNNATTGGGIFNDSSSPILKNSIIANSTGGDCRNGNSSSINSGSSHNLIESTGTDACDITTGFGGGSNIIGSDPALGTLTGSPAYFPLNASSPALSAGSNTTCAAAPVNNTSQNGVTRPQGGICDIGSFEFSYASVTVLYAKPAATGNGSCLSWVNACKLQTALSAASSGSQIWVMAGKHIPGATRTDTFQLKTGVAVYGGFAGTETLLSERNAAANITILSGDIDNNDTNTDGNNIAETTTDIQGNNSYHVVTGSGTTSTAILDGFTITAGQANVPDTTNDSGGGMYNNTGAPTVNNATFSGNFAHSSGGGMYNSSSSPTVSNSTFFRNSAYNGGGIYNDANSPTITNSTFSNNSASSFGGGIYNSNSSTTISNSAFVSNSANFGGGGMFNSNSSPTIINSTFSANSSSLGSGGGIYSNGGSPTIINSTFSGNSAGSGGGIYNVLSDPALKNVIIANSSAGDCVGSNLNISSSHNLIESTGANACDITPTFGGGGNIIGSDPNLGSLTGSPAYFPLNTGSPAINTGSNAICAAYPVNNQSQNGVIRPQGANCDIGAVEVLVLLSSSTFKSTAANDGWILESTETSNTGGTLNNAQTTFILGDDAADKQYRAILHFDTSALPDTAVVTNMTLKIKQQGSVTGVSPFTFASLYVDMRNPAFGASALELTDFNFAAKKVKPAVFNPTPVSGWFSARFNNGGNLYVNRTGVSQLRLYFSVDDNNNNIADFIRFFSGNAAAGDRPKLLITYYVP